MGYTAPTTRATDDLITAAIWNADLVNNVAFLANPPKCRVYNNAAISVPGNTNTILTFNAERYDTDTIHSTSSNTSRLTCVTAGTYQIFGHVTFASAGTDRRFLQILLGGSTSLGAIDVPGGALSLSVNTTYALTAGQYVELQVYQNSGGALNVNSTAAYSPEFGMTWVSL